MNTNSIVEIKVVSNGFVVTSFDCLAPYSGDKIASTLDEALSIAKDLLITALRVPLSVTSTADQLVQVTPQS